jgi:hypothetical protein
MSGCTPYITAIWKAGVELGRPTDMGRLVNHPEASRRARVGAWRAASACSSTARESPSIWMMRKRRGRGGGMG